MPKRLCFFLQTEYTSFGIFRSMKKIHKLNRGPVSFIKHYLIKPENHQLLLGSG